MAEPGFEFQSWKGPGISHEVPGLSARHLLAHLLHAFGGGLMPACPGLGVGWLQGNLGMALWSLKVSEYWEVGGCHLVDTQHVHEYGTGTWFEY